MNVESDGGKNHKGNIMKKRRILTVVFLGLLLMAGSVLASCDNIASLLGGGSDSSGEKSNCPDGGDCYVSPSGNYQWCGKSSCGDEDYRCNC
jgi:hypothetical protein